MLIYKPKHAIVTGNSEWAFRGRPHGGRARGPRKGRGGRAEGPRPVRGPLAWPPRAAPMRPCTDPSAAPERGQSINMCAKQCGSLHRRVAKQVNGFWECGSAVSSVGGIDAWAIPPERTERAMEVTQNSHVPDSPSTTCRFACGRGAQAHNSCQVVCPLPNHLHSTSVLGHIHRETYDEMARSGAGDFIGNLAGQTGRRAAQTGIKGWCMTRQRVSFWNHLNSKPLYRHFCAHFQSFC